MILTIFVTAILLVATVVLVSMDAIDEFEDGIGIVLGAFFAALLLIWVAVRSDNYESGIRDYLNGEVVVDTLSSGELNFTEVVPKERDTYVEYKSLAEALKSGAVKIDTLSNGELVFVEIKE